MTFASEFANDVETISKTLLELSTSNAGVAAAELKARVVGAINNVQAKYKDFVKYANTIVGSLSQFPSLGRRRLSDKNGKIDKAFDGVKLLEDIAGKSAMVLDVVSLKPS